MKLIVIAAALVSYVLRIFGWYNILVFIFAIVYISEIIRYPVSILTFLTILMIQFDECNFLFAGEVSVYQSQS